MASLKHLLDYASLFPLMLLTSGLLFLSNGWNPIFMRTEGIVWASSHFLSQLAVVGTAWALVLLDRFRGAFWNVLAMFNLGSLHEILFARAYYIRSLDILIGTSLSLLFSIFLIALTLKSGIRWQKIGLGAIAVFLPFYYFLVAQYQPTVLLSGGFNQPWASEVLPNLAEIGSWIGPCVLLLLARRFES